MYGGIKNWLFLGTVATSALFIPSPVQAFTPQGDEKIEQVGRWGGHHHRHWGGGGFGYRSWGPRFYGYGYPRSYSYYRPYYYGSYGYPSYYYGYPYSSSYYYRPYGGLYFRLGF